MNPVESPAATAVRHPLEPLTGDEIRLAAAIARRERNLGPAARFVFISLGEPARADLIAWEAADDPAPLPRMAAFNLWERSEGVLYEGVADLGAGTLVRWDAVPGALPPFLWEELLGIEEAVKSDARWQAAVAARGVTDPSLCMVDPWPSGHTGPQDDPVHGRIARPLTFVRTSPNDHGYARPVEGLVVTIAIDTMEVLEVEDHGVVPLPPHPGNYEPELMYEPGNIPAFDGPRTDVKPIVITQPEGPSFTLDGHHLTWQKWDLRIGFTPREGLVLHRVSYLDGGRLRPILHRASLSEMYIPYADPRPTHYRKNVFDEGEVGLGILANPLQLGCDCLGEIRYLDAVVNDNDGEPMVMRNAVCIHEEDRGIAWKHTDFRTEKAEVRRSRRLVISFIATVGNYEYGYFWYLSNDGTIEYEVKLSGVISSGALAPGETPDHGNLVAPGLYGPHHQHFFCVRLDMCVDGPGNSVYEVDSVAVPPGEENPYGNAWVTRALPLDSESVAQRTLDPMAGRYWKIVNNGSLNRLGQPVAYKLMPGGNVSPMWQPDGQQGRRGAFCAKHLWVTAHDPEQMYAGGAYVWQNPGPDGLPVYAAADRDLTDTDLTVWYVFGAHHIVRPEDWPVMPVARIGFELKPLGFFDGNPALDLPRPSSHACHHHAHHQEVTR